MTMTDTISSFTPARSDVAMLQAERRTVENTPLVTTIMDAMPDFAMVLNEHRQIVSVNKRLLNILEFSDVGHIVGRRIGEALNCAHFGDGADGCGTAPNCSVCGAARAIIDCQQTGKQAVGECRISLKKDSHSDMDFETTATPLSIDGTNFTILAMKDISAEKRKQVMEKTFFHDIINTVGGIRGIAQLLVEFDSLPREKENKYKSWMLTLSDNLIEEINHNRRLLAAERGDYEPVLKPTDLATLLQEVCALYEHHERIPGRIVHLADLPQCTLQTDGPVVRRIVGNMVLNALEAVPKGETITISCRLLPDRARIEVSNPGVMAPEVQLQIFKRSFSTKSELGRGIGTYSMKLFGERYLKGKVGFVSRDGQTTFFVELPL